MLWQHPQTGPSLLSSTEVSEKFGSGLGLPAIWNRKFQIKAVLPADNAGTADRKGKWMRSRGRAGGDVGGRTKPSCGHMSAGGELAGGCLQRPHCNM